MTHTIPVPRTASWFYVTEVVKGSVKRPHCNCYCHEGWGGGAHPSQSCRCKGGEGFDDLSGQPTMTQIAVGDRVLFTNPETGQQLIGTVAGHDPEHRLDREWRVDFDSYMFEGVNTRTAYVAAADLAPFSA